MFLHREIKRNFFEQTLHLSTFLYTYFLQMTISIEWLKFQCNFFEQRNSLFDVVRCTLNILKLYHIHLESCSNYRHVETKKESFLIHFYVLFLGLLNILLLLSNFFSEILIKINQFLHIKIQDMPLKFLCKLFLLPLTFLEVGKFHPLILIILEVDQIFQNIYRVVLGHV